MANGQSLFRGLQDIGTSLGQLSRQELQRQQKLQDAITLMRIKAQLERQSTPSFQQNIESLRGLFPDMFQEGIQKTEPTRVEPRPTDIDVSTRVDPSISQIDPVMSLTTGQIGDITGRAISANITEPTITREERPLRRELTEITEPPFITKPSLSINPITGSMNIGLTQVENPEFGIQRNIRLAEEKARITEDRRKREQISKIKNKTEDVNTALKLIRNNLDTGLSEFFRISTAVRGPGPIQRFGTAPIARAFPFGGRFQMGDSFKIINKKTGEITEDVIDSEEKLTRLNTNPLKFYEDFQGAFLSLLARELGERGVLTDKDIERVQLLFPQVSGFQRAGDDEFTARRKTNAIFDLINRKISEFNSKTERQIRNIERFGPEEGQVLTTPGGIQFSIQQIGE